VISPRTIIVSLVLGTGITVAAAIAPARRASRVAPIEALRESVAPSASIRRRVIFGSLVTLAGAVALFAGLFGSVSNAGLVVGLGAGLTFLGVAMLSPLFARPLAAAIGRPFRGKISGKLGSENANRNPRRTASTAAALMIGLGLVAFVAVFAASLKTSATATLSKVLAADLTLNSDQFSPFSPQLAKDLAKDPEYSVVAPFRQAEAHVGQSDTFVTAGQPIEVMVEGTHDVTEMALSDGRGDALPMVRDSTSDTWRVNYRVPLRPKTDRLGLAVTAKNDSHMWRRVWVFLQVDDGKQKVEPEPGPLDPEQK